MVQLVKVASSHYEFTIKNLDKVVPTISTTKMESVTVEWEMVVPGYEQTLVTLYFFGKYNDLNLVHPLKVLLTVV